MPFPKGRFFALLSFFPASLPAEWKPNTNPIKYPSGIAEIPAGATKMSILLCLINHPLRGATFLFANRTGRKKTHLTFRRGLEEGSKTILENSISQFIPSNDGPFASQSLPRREGVENCRRSLPLCRNKAGANNRLPLRNVTSGVRNNAGGGRGAGSTRAAFLRIHISTPPSPGDFGPADCELIETDWIRQSKARKKKFNFRTFTVEGVGGCTHPCEPGTPVCV